MAWRITEDVDEFLAGAGDFLRSRPVENTVLLTVADSVRRGAYPAGALFGWAAEGGAYVRTVPRPSLVSAMSPDVARELVAALDGQELTGVLGPDDVVEVFTVEWQRRTRGHARVRGRQRLYRLGALKSPVPHPSGGARKAVPADRELLVEWMTSFFRDVGETQPRPEQFFEEKLAHGGIMLWEDAGRPVSMAALTRPDAGMVRVQAVYTPVPYRARGYGGAITTAVSQAARDAGAAEVVLFTDLANPTSNALYQRLGYVPLEDRTMMEFTA
ncbi:GNAT family N-acetyltransferase [Symbioplanes lichenis]|uniref:GNAT family N-acetyltransferase n=1 Tax=Symbioplanes lichenis TaxID=1629072 RepID=UPI002739BDCB|nr:GNAT family N-acetyltransferase [Actinoplanes lichenis]